MSKDDFAWMDIPVFALELSVTDHDGTQLQDADGKPIWYPHSLWFTYEEAEDYAESIAFRQDEFRIYSYGARGSLKQILKEHTID